MVTTPLAKSATTPLEYEEIVIGSNLTAVLYAFNNRLPIFFSVPDRPFRFDYLTPGLELEFINMENTTRQLVTHHDNIEIGLSKEFLWERLLFMISMSGRAPLSTLCSSMRYERERLICSNDYGKIAEVHFQKAYYFGDENCSGLINEKTVANPHYICYDWIAFNRGGKHEIDLIETTDKFVNQIWFYPTDRIDGNSPIKDACLISTLTQAQLQDFDYSQTMARFKMIAEMRERGMRGPFNGYSPTGAPKHYNFRTSIIGRQTRKKPAHPYAAIPQVEVPRVQEKTLLQDLPQVCVDSYRLLERL